MAFPIGCLRGVFVARNADFFARSAMIGVVDTFVRLDIANLIDALANAVDPFAVLADDGGVFVFAIEIAVFAFAAFGFGLARHVFAIARFTRAAFIVAFVPHIIYTFGDITDFGCGGAFCAFVVAAFVADG